jgi:hypothetical protein
MPSFSSQVICHHLYIYNLDDLLASMASQTWQNCSGNYSTDTNARVFRPGEVQWHAKEHRTDKLGQFKKQLILK